MLLGFQRALLRLLVTLGIVLSLSPFAAQMRLSWIMVMRPVLTATGRQEPLDKEEIKNLGDSARMRKAYARDPYMLGATFVVAPVGLGLIFVGMKGLRRLRRPSRPVWPADYRPGAVP